MLLELLFIFTSALVFVYSYLLKVSTCVIVFRTILSFFMLLAVGFYIDSILKLSLSYLQISVVSSIFSILLLCISDQVELIINKFKNKED